MFDVWHSRSQLFFLMHTLLHSTFYDTRKVYNFPYIRSASKKNTNSVQKKIHAYLGAYGKYDFALSICLEPIYKLNITRIFVLLGKIISVAISAN